MRKILTTALVSLGLMGGVALADDHHDRDDRYDRRDTRYDRDRDHDRDRHVDERYREGRRDYRWNRGREVHYRDYRVRPQLRFERHVDRRGFAWVPGQWQWNSFEWIWVPGHYERVYYRPW